uniref:Protein dpy-19 3 n=1 Tax=Ascaris suum TaxID=6253 RepID=F1KZP4_ASCSU
MIRDFSTEYPREINILERFNIYQELLLAAVYKTLKRCTYFTNYLGSPIIFYVYSCFVFAGFGVITLFLLAWATHKSWIYGLLAFAWICANLDDSTRTFFTVNLRENFALPFFWLQNFFAVCILQQTSSRSINSLFAFMLSTFFFAIFWQFNQFILLLQSSALFVVSLLIPSRSKMIAILLFAQSIAFVCVVIAQFGQPMALLSVCTSFNIAAIVVLLVTSWRFHSTTNKAINPIVVAFIKAIVTVVLFACINIFLKVTTNSKADTHIWTFVMAKLGIHRKSPVPFETALYLCHGAFKFIDWGFFQRTSASGCLILYAFSLVFIALFLVYSLVRQAYSDEFEEKKLYESISPAMIFLAIQSLLCAMIAIFTLRMKYLWFPQMTIVAMWILSITSRYVVLRSGKILAFAIAVALLFRQYGIYKQQMSLEQEFYDPDTVQLMEWISSTTPPTSSWAGSMQLMAGVKACTGRNLANHPHFEDKWLRDRTQRIYQIYGRKSVIDVHRILQEESVDYIILEDSICLAQSNGCSTNDLIDLSNGEMPDSRNTEFGSVLRVSAEPRFCERIRHPDEETATFFKLVFSNRTFRVYKVV